MTSVAVIGAGDGGLAVAGHLALHGYEVRLHDVDSAAVAAVAASGVIEVEGRLTGRARITLASTDLGAAVRDAALVMVVTPADAHGAVAEALAPHLRAGQTVVLHPGGTGGAFELASVFRRRAVPRGVRLAEIESFLFGARRVAPARAEVRSVKRHGRVAALPASDTPAVLALLQRAFPQLVAGQNVLQTSLNHMNAMMHVAGMVLNAGWVETTRGGFDFYRDGVSPAVAQVVEAVDAERMAVSAAFGAEATSLRDWIGETYQVTGASLHETVQTLHTTVYKSSPAPASLTSRYLAEDVPTGLVPIAALGEVAETATPLSRGLIALTSQLHGRDHWVTGRTLDRMGLTDLSMSAIQQIAETG